jgi:4a-hydroxytetrahydrobiopterin dehydratase
VNPSLKAWDFCGWQGLRTPAKPFLKYPAIKGRVSARGRMNDLTKKKCAPCAAGVNPMKGKTLVEWKQQLGAGWSIVEEHHLEKEYRFKNFQGALDFTCEIGGVAETEGHHPTIILTWGKVTVKIWTHKINGLSENDFILAAKCDRCYSMRNTNL